MNKNESKYFNTASKMDDALIKLLETKDFEYITVIDICKEAKVNRSTFYLHYTNLCDLLTEVIERLNESFNKHLKSVANQRTIIYGNGLKDSFLITDDFLIPYLTFIKENKYVYKAIRSNPIIFGANKTYEQMFDDVFTPIMYKFGLEQKWHKYIMDFYINGISIVVLNWVNDDCKIDIREVVEFIKNLIPSFSKENLSIK